MKKEHQYKVGVVIGRFQVPELTAGHRHLIDSALRLCQRRLILIGSAGAAFTSRNPLPYEAREDMIKSTYDSEDITIARLHDASDDQAWSENVDETIKYHFGSLLTTAEPAVLLHGRDSLRQALHHSTSPSPRNPRDPRCERYDGATQH